MYGCEMWLAVIGTLLLALFVVIALVPICDLPYSPYSDEFTVLQALRAAMRAELRKRRAATARDVKLLMLGLDGSGKSALVEYWLRGEISSKSPAPTTGFNIQELNEPQAWWMWKGGVRLNVWELGGAAAIRPYWSRCAPLFVDRLRFQTKNPLCGTGTSMTRARGLRERLCSLWTQARPRDSPRRSKSFGRRSSREFCQMLRQHWCFVSQRLT